MIMTEEIRQDGKVVLSSDAEHAIPMISTTFAERTSQGKNTVTISAM